VNRPLGLSGSSSRRYPADLRERAVRMVAAVPPLAILADLVSGARRSGVPSLRWRFNLTRPLATELVCSLLSLR
jgi:hypothetical protein